jgi:hypothetical protein
MLVIAVAYVVVPALQRLLLSDADVHIAPKRSLGAPIERNRR